MKKLFSSLISGGFASEALEFNKRWQISLPKEFHAFAGDYHRFRGRWAPFKFYAGETSDLIPVPAVKLKLAPPLATKKVSLKDYVSSLPSCDCSHLQTF